MSKYIIIAALAKLLDVTVIIHYYSCISSWMTSSIYLFLHHLHHLLDVYTFVCIIR